MPITDKELLAICNLSNLKMEFANLKKEETKKETTDKNEDLSAEKILSYHTIYSLLEKEYNRFKDNLPLKEENIVFYQKDDNKNILPEYKEFKELRKTAPIVMEYFDRYREAIKKDNHEGKFLTEWEIIYSADLYQIVIDYSYELYSIFYDNIKKEEFIKSQKIPSRAKVSQNKITIEIVDIIKKIFLLGNYQNIHLNNFKKILEKIGDFETISKNNLLENISQDILLKELNKATFLFKAILRNSDFKVLILKHQKNKNFIIAINDFSSTDDIAKSLREGKINYDLHILNKFFLSKIKANSSNNYTNIKYTGYGVGSQVALYMNEINLLDNKISAKIFTGKEKYTFDKIINFDLENSSIVLENFEIICHGFSDITLEILKIIEGSMGNLAKGVILINIINFFSPGTASLASLGGIAGVSSIGGFVSEIFPPAVIMVIATVCISTYFHNSKVEAIYEKLQKFGVISLKDNYKLVNRRFIEAISIFELNIENKSYFPINIQNKVFYLPKELVILLCTSSNYYLNIFSNEIVINTISPEKFEINKGLVYIIQFNNNNIFKKMIKRTTILKTNNENIDTNLQVSPDMSIKNTYLKIHNKQVIIEETKENLIEGNEKRIINTEDISSEINMSNLLTEIGFLQQSMNFNTFSLKNTEIVYMDIVPKITSKLNEVKYTKSSSFVYFPFIRKDGMLAEEIREEYIGTILRSLYGMKDCKYDIFEHVNENNLEPEKKTSVHIHEAGNYISPSNSRACSDIINIEYCNRILRYGLGKILDEHVVAVKSKLAGNIDFLEKFYKIEEDKNNPNRGTVLIGILNDKKNDYAKDKIGFIYNSEDRLYGCILEEKLYFTEQSLLEEISTTGVCDGATLSCSGGTTTSSLKVTSQNLEETNGKLLATEEDCIMNSNISPFGNCKLCGDKNKACINHWSLGKWEEISIGQEIDGKKLLISTSKLECKSMKGIISITNSNTPGKDN